MNGANLLVAALESKGAKQIFGLPGAEDLECVEARRGSKIKLSVARHEQAAAFMAATHGRLTGEARVCLSMLGLGALNLRPAPPTRCRRSCHRPNGSLSRVEAAHFIAECRIPDPHTFDLFTKTCHAHHQQF